MRSNVNFTSALNDFWRARRQAAIQSILGRMTGRGSDLLSYEEIRKQVKGVESAYRELKDIPLNSIIGSVNRYTDFTRDFLPKGAIDGKRWARVKAAGQEMVGLPPIDVYQIGEAYFVLDGNHRVSIARQEGNRYIQAYVKEVHTKIPLTPETKPDDLIIKSEFAEFLETTHIDELRPNTTFKITSPGRYPSILQQIEAVQFSLELRERRGIAYEDAVLYWHDNVYMPIIETIRDYDLLRDFPDRTETDLFNWIVKFQSELTKDLGWEITTASAASTLSRTSSTKALRFVKKIVNIVVPDLLKPSPKVGQWRQAQLATHQGRMFADIMVVSIEDNKEWNTLEFGLDIAENEGSQIYGIQLLKSKNSLNPEQKQKIIANFNDQLNEVSVNGTLVFEASHHPERTILQRARFADLVILPLFDGQKSSNGFNLSIIIKRCPTPILVIPKDVQPPFNRALLAYDGSPKAEEALYLAAYVAKFWELSLVVMTVEGVKTISPETLFQASEFLEGYNIKANLIKSSGPPATATLTFAEEDQCDLIVLGGYGSNLFKRIVKGGSLIDEIIEKSNHPILICQ